MKKKVVSLLLVTTMVASLAAGCGDSSSSGDGTEKTGNMELIPVAKGNPQ